MSSEHLEQPKRATWTVVRDGKTWATGEVDVRAEDGPFGAGWKLEFDKDPEGLCHACLYTGDTLTITYPETTRGGKTLTVEKRP